MRVLALFAIGLALVMALLPHPPALPGNPNDKLVHSATFIVLALLVSYGWPRAGFWRILILLFAFGGLIELLQGTSFIHRDASAWDLVADTVAVLVMLSLLRMTTRLWSQPSP